MLRPGKETLEEILGSAENRGKGTGSDLFSKAGAAVPTVHETFRLEAADCLSLPSVIIPYSGDSEDFFATVATYYQDLSPISAVTHVLSRETEKLFRAKVVTERLSYDAEDERFRNADLGAAMGEATLAGLMAQDYGGSVSYSTCRRTLAFCLSRATVLYGPALARGVVADRWATLRKLTGLNVSSASVETVLLVHDYLRGQAANLKFPIHPEISKPLDEFVRGHDPDGSKTFAAIMGLYPEAKDNLHQLRGIFDARMSAFIKLSEIARRAPHGTRTNEVVVAFVCNQILPGSFAHVGALARLLDFLPGALIWYGMFAALSRATASKELRSGLIGKLERDLIDHFSFEQRPRCDISFEELEILSRVNLRAEGVRPTQQRALLVGLLPGVDVYTRFGSEIEALDDRARHSSDLDRANQRIARLLEEALHLLRRPDGPSNELPLTNKRQRRDR